MNKTQRIKSNSRIGFVTNVCPFAGMNAITTAEAICIRILTRAKMFQILRSFLENC
jgi:hypothetical protein